MKPMILGLCAGLAMAAGGVAAQAATVSIDYETEAGIVLIDPNLTPLNTVFTPGESVGVSLAFDTMTTVFADAAETRERTTGTYQFAGATSGAIFSGVARLLVFQLPLVVGQQVLVEFEVPGGLATRTISDADFTPGIDTQQALTALSTGANTDFEALLAVTERGVDSDGVLGTAVVTSFGGFSGQPTVSGMTPIPLPAPFALLLTVLVGAFGLRRFGPAQPALRAA